MMHGREGILPWGFQGLGDGSVARSGGVATVNNTYFSVLTHFSCVNVEVPYPS